jgi:hypothetical protein
MPKRSTSNLIDIRTGKPVEAPKRKPAAKAPPSSETTEYKWEFKPRFRKKAFGWKSQPAITRIREAVSEIKKVARSNSALAGEGAVLFLERLSPAIENIDGSSGAIGSAVNKSIEDLVPIIANATVDRQIREEWLERLFKAHEEDKIPYIERMGDFWGDLCSTQELASKWADDLIDCVRIAWSNAGSGAFFHGTSACLSALLKAERYKDLLELLKIERHQIWHYQQFGVRAMAKMGKISEAIKFAEVCAEKRGESTWIAHVCEELLLEAGLVDEAYERFAIMANRQNSYLSTYRAIAKKYPSLLPQRILMDLIEASPGEESKWFATAKDLGLLELALKLAREGPCDPKTLSRAARDHVQSNPEFAMNVGLAALAWLFKGYGYEVSSVDVWAAYESTIKAAQVIGEEEQVRSRIFEAVQTGLAKRNWVADVLAREFRLR